MNTRKAIISIWIKTIFKYSDKLRDSEAEGIIKGIAIVNSLALWPWKLPLNRKLQIFIIIFSERVQTHEVYKFFISRNFLLIRLCSRNFQNFVVEWFTFWNFNNFQNYWKLSRKIFLPLEPISKNPKFLVLATKQRISSVRVCNTKFKILFIQDSKVHIRDWFTKHYCVGKHAVKSELYFLVFSKTANLQNNKLNVQTVNAK